jgi:hypothetical protein
MEDKKLAGAALGAKRQKEVTTKVRDAIHNQMGPAAGDKIHANFINSIESVLNHTEKLLAHEGVSPKVKAKIRSARAHSRLKQILADLTKEEG